MDKVVTVAGKSYTVAPLVMSPETIELLECAYDMQTDNFKAIRALPLVYHILVDCMVRGGDVSKDEAVDVLRGMEISQETIGDLLRCMMGNA